MSDEGVKSAEVVCKWGETVRVEWKIGDYELELSVSRPGATWVMTLEKGQVATLGYALSRAAGSMQ